MKDFIKDYNNTNEENINFDLMTRSHDADLTEYVVNTCKSLEVLKYIKFIGYEYITDETKIDINYYMSTRKKSKKKNETKYMYLQDSRYGEMHLKFHLKCKDRSLTFIKKILLPVADDNDYYLVKGKRHSLLYQLVDSSTYTTRQNLTLKSLRPITMKRTERIYSDTDGTKHSAPSYAIYIFKKEVDILLFYFAKIGVSRTLEYFSVNHIMKFKSEIEDTINNIYFSINSKLHVEINRHFFDKYPYVKSIVFMILNICTNRLTVEDLENKSFWIEKIGSMNATNAYNYLEKGTNTLVFFDRLLDETTKNILKIHDENNKNIYSVIRWIKL